MKRFLLYLLTIAAFVACSKGEDEGNGNSEPTPEKPKTEIKIETSTSDFTTEGGDNTISFTTNEAWTAQVINSRADDWCKIHPTSGAAGNATITVTTTPNDTPDDRTASIIIKAGAVSKTVTVSQKQKDALTITASKFEVAAAGGEVVIEVNANIDFEYVINDDAKEWISYEGTRALKTSKLAFKIAENDDIEKREGQIFIKNGELVEAVTIYQDGAEPSIVISKNEYVVSSDGETISVEVKSNVDVAIELTAEADWISENTSRATSTNTYRFDISPNESYDQRSAEIKFTNKENNLSEIVRVTQTQKNALVVAKDSYTVDSEGDQIQIEIGHNVDFDIEIANDWITKVDTRAFVTETLVFNIAKHTGYDNREGTIVFKSKDGKLSQTVKVYQAQEDALIISKKDIVVSDEGGTISFELQTNVEFKVSDPNVDWLRAITTRGLATHTLSYTVDANTSYDSREAHIIVTDTKNNKSETITITQAQKDAIVLAKSEYEFGAEGGNLDFEIQTNVDITVTISDNAKDWIQQVETRALETKALYFNVAACSAEEDREGTITISGGNATQTIKVKQIAKVEINPNDVPDNEIWYRTTDNQLYRFGSTKKSPFDKEILSHTYKNGIGIIKCSGTITRINNEAFAIYNGNSSNLAELYLPNSIESIEDYGICCNPNLEIIKVSNNLRYLGFSSLSYHKNLVKIIGKNVTDDGRCLIIDNTLYAFAPKGITSYEIPSNVEIIENCVFAESELESINFPEGLLHIGMSAFSDCVKITSITFPKSLETMHTYAFKGCMAVEGFYGNEKFHTSDNKCLISLTNIGIVICGFAGKNITEYTIPEGIVGIENYAFYNAINLRKLNFPNSIKRIGPHAFEGATNIETITGENVLEDNRSLVVDSTLIMVAGGGLEKYITPKEVKYLSQSVLGFNNDIKEYVISDNVIEVGGSGYMFIQCPNLETVTISANMKYLGYDPFGSEEWNTPKIKTVYCRAMIPPIVYYNYYGRFDFDDLTIYVPEQSLDLYKNSNYWAPYKDYIKGYEYTDLPEIDHYISTDYSQDGKVTTLQTATKGNGIDIVLMGDAYSDRQIADGTYKSVMENMYNNLFTEEPYKSFKDHFNVYYVNVVSIAEGYKYGNTALEGFFGDGTFVGGNDSAVFNYALKAISEEEMDEALLIVAMNSDNYAGTCYMYNPVANTDYGRGVSVSYFPKGGNAETFAQLLHHEACGHGFAKLADEYAYENMGGIPEAAVNDHKAQQTNWGWWKNVDFTSDPTKVRWNYFLTDTRYANDGLGAFEGGLTYWTGVWRPTENSIMRYNTGGFNAPSREAIYYRIHKLAYGEDWEYDYEKFVEWDAKNRKTAAATRGVPYKSTSYKPTHPPVVINKSWRDAK